VLSASRPIPGRDDIESSIRRVGSSDARAGVDALYRAYGSSIFASLYLMLKDSEVAKDLTQEVFVRAYTREGFFAGDFPLRAWLLKVASRLALNHVRETKRRSRREGRAVPAAVKDPLEEILSRQLRAELNQKVQSLPLPYRQALVLRYHEQLSCEEIAAILEVPPGTVMSHLYRARLVLRRRL
jgi:RNA polymerase sigma-70 factor (ECF subfamily)